MGYTAVLAVPMVLNLLFWGSYDSWHRALCVDEANHRQPACNAFLQLPGTLQVPTTTSRLHSSLQSHSKHMPEWMVTGT